MKIYVASRFEDAAIATIAADVLAEAGHLITCRWWSLEENLHPGDGESREVQIRGRRFLASTEISAVRACDQVVKIGPGGCGAATEVGCAIGLDKPVHMVLTADSLRAKPLDLSVFWFHPLVRIHSVLSLTELHVRPVVSNIAQQFVNG